MKIGHPAEKPAPSSTTSSTASTAAAQVGTTSAASAIPDTADASATIQLSSTASSLLSNDGSAEFDTEKVARISKAIDDGSFKIDAGAIADKLIANAHEVLAKFSS